MRDMVDEKEGVFGGWGWKSDYRVMDYAVVVVVRGVPDAGERREKIKARLGEGG